MQAVETGLPGVLILEPAAFEDERGFFFESWNRKVFQEATGFPGEFVQDNHSQSRRGVLRGLHYQLERPQGKLIRACIGEVLDVAVDLRHSSRYFGRWVKVLLSAENRRQLWIPPGFGHGYVVRSESADVLYKVTEYWNRDSERCILWSDPQLAIDWELRQAPILSEKDAAGASLAGIELFG